MRPAELAGDMRIVQSHPRAQINPPQWPNNDLLRYGWIEDRSFIRLRSHTRGCLLGQHRLRRRSREYMASADGPAQASEQRWCARPGQTDDHATLQRRAFT